MFALPTVELCPHTRMASLFSRSLVVAASRTGRGEDQVYVASVPLRAPKGPSQLLLSAAYSLNLWNLQHFLVIIKRSSPSNPPVPSQVVVFDFQPKDPESIDSALAVLSGKAIPGTVMRRTLSKLPRSKCWFVGSSTGSAVDMATQFSSGWKTDLRIGLHDCRDYTNGLVEYLTGEKDVLGRIRRSMNYGNLV